MLRIAELDKGIELTNSRFLLCVLVSQCAKRIRLNYAYKDNIAFSIKKALRQIIHGEAKFLLPAALTENAPRLSLLGSGRTSDEITMSLFALARAELEEEGWVYVGRNYSIQVGISTGPTDEEFDAYPFELTLTRDIETLPFDFLIHLTGNLKLIGNWHQRLLYDSTDADPQLVDFNFEVIGTGRNHVKIDCYYKRQWLRTIDFTFDAIEMRALKATT
jgi:hypothetical protein